MEVLKLRALPHPNRTMKRVPRNSAMRADRMDMGPDFCKSSIPKKARTFLHLAAMLLGFSQPFVELIVLKVFKLK